MTLEAQSIVAPPRNEVRQRSTKAPYYAACVIGTRRSYSIFWQQVLFDLFQNIFYNSNSIFSDQSITWSFKQKYSPRVYYLFYSHRSEEDDGCHAHSMNCESNTGSCARPHVKISGRISHWRYRPSECKRAYFGHGLNTWNGRGSVGWWCHWNDRLPLVFLFSSLGSMGTQPWVRLRWHCPWLSH